MNAIEIKGLTKVYGQKNALAGLDMTVPLGAIYGFIGENGSGKSTTEKIISGLVNQTSGSVRLFGREHTDADVKRKIGVLIEAPGCFPGMSVFENLMLVCANLGIKDAEREVVKALKLVRMEGAAGNKYKNCSLGMKQRVGIAAALLGNPKLLILDEPINGLDADGMRIMREVLTSLSKEHGVTILISSHILGELEKIATHYGIVRGGKMIAEMTAKELDADCPTYVSVRAGDMKRAKNVLTRLYSRVEEVEGYLRIYDAERTEDVVLQLYENGVIANEVGTSKISLEEYYMSLIGKREV